MNYAVIMAGGIGSRFWPQSRKARPKQFLNVFGEATLIQNTVARMQGLVPPERCLVVTHERYVEATRNQLPAVPEENILAEPISRNTAPCIAYAAARLKAEDPDAAMVVLPADHVIRNTRRFHAVLRVALDKAQEPGALVTIGVRPTHPETGYGYVQFDPEARSETAASETAEDAASGDGAAEAAPEALPVRTFAEKPDLATAERFLDSGDFLWNSGMFVWRADTILEQMAKHLPEVRHAFGPVEAAVGTGAEQEAVAEAFRQSPSISIDYGVMERAESVHVVPASFGWSDVGDWRAVYELGEKNEHGNVIAGNAIVHDASRSYVQAEAGRLVVLVGAHDLVVVDTKDAVLVCGRESTQQVKNVVEYLHAHQLEEYI